MLQSAKSWRTITQRTYLKYFCCSTFSFISSSINLTVFDFSVSDMKSEGQLRFKFSLFPSFSSNSRSVRSQLLNNHCQCFIYTSWNEVCELQNMDSRKILCTKTRFDLFLGNSFSLNLRMLFNYYCRCACLESHQVSPLRSTDSLFSLLTGWAASQSLILIAWLPMHRKLHKDSHQITGTSSSLMLEIPTTWLQWRSWISNNCTQK